MTIDAESSLGETIAGNVRRAREERGVSLADLAQAAGVSKATLSNLESGRANPTIETLGALAASLQLPLGDLIQAQVDDVLVRRGQPQDKDVDQQLLQRVPGGAFTELWHLRLRPTVELNRRAHAAGTFEHILVTAGSLTCGPIDNDVGLDAGDFVTFRADVDHRYIALSEGAEATVMMTYPAVLAPYARIRRPEQHRRS